MAQIHICRTCLEVIGKPSSFVSLEGSNAKSLEIKSKLEACVPEMTINTVKSPVICGRCLISLNASYEFKRKCIATEEEIYSYLFDTNSDAVDLQLIANQCSVDKPYCYDVVGEINEKNIKQELQPAIRKTEDTEISSIKVEEKDDYEDFLISSVKQEDFEVTDHEISLPNNVTEVSTDYEKDDEIDESKNQCLPNCQVVLERLSEDLLKNLPRITNENSNSQSEDNVCYVCYPYSSTAVEPMKIDQCVKTSDSKKCYRCGVCGFTSASKMNLHMRIHTGEKPHKCKVCGFATAYRSHLKGHLKIHSKIESYRCGYCDFNINTEIGLRNHMTDNHPGCQIFKCQLCEYSTEIPKDLKYHKLIHADKPFFECATCKFKTCYKSALKVHVKTHFAMKPYQCPICGFSTAYQQSLYKHLRTHNIGDSD